MDNGFDLEARNISVCRDGKLILHRVSFRVEPATLTAIIGPNGAGKTTLMRALAGERPDEGQVIINGDNLYDAPEYWLQRIGYVPVDNVLHEHLTLWKALLYIGKLRLPDRSIEQIHARVDSLLDEFGFPTDDPRRHRQVHSLSSGERKRANICGELLIDPPILMLDEPTSNLDPDAEWNLMRLLARYAHDHGQTIIVITHTLNTISFCDHVIFIENARKRAIGSHMKVLEELETETDPAGSLTDLMHVHAAQASTGLPSRVEASTFSRWASVFARYKTREEDRKDCSLVCSVPLRHLRSLEAGVISDDLLGELERCGIDLDAGATVSELEVKSHYLVRSQRHVYRLRRTGDEIDVYDSSRKRRRRDKSIVVALNRKPKVISWQDQLRYLLSRYTEERLGDRCSLLLTLLAGFSGILLFVLPSNTFVMPFDPGEVGLVLNQARQSVYIVGIVVTLLGMITSYTEISKEFRIYRHERLKGLSPSAYFLSKWIWLAGAVGVVAPILLMAFIVLVYRQPLPGFDQPRPGFGENPSFWQYLTRYQLPGLLHSRSSWLVLTTLVLACITSVTVGLLISSMAGDSGKGYLYLTFMTVFIVLFSGLIRNERLETLIDSLSFASAGKWAYSGIASSINLYCWGGGWRFDEFNSAGHVVSIWLSLVAYFLVAAFMAILILRMRDPWYRIWTNLERFFRESWPAITIYVVVLVLLLSYVLFLRQGSKSYHSLTYWSNGSYGGTNADHYARVENVENLTFLQRWYGTVSQPWCGQ